MPGKQKGVHHDGTPFADPNRPAWATVNRLDGGKRKKTEVKLRLPQGVLDLVNESAGVFGKNQRNDWLTRAALEAMKLQGVDVPAEVDEAVPRFDVEHIPEKQFDPEFLRNQLG